MAGNEPEVMQPCPLTVICGYFTQEEVAVIKAVMAYLGIAFIGCRQARLILWFIRKFHEKYGSQ